MQVLVSNGADVALDTSEHSYPIAAATEIRVPQLAQWLVRAGADPNALPSVPHAWDATASTNRAVNRSDAPLLLSCARNSAKVAAVLIDMGARTDYRHPIHGTALEFCAREGLSACFHVIFPHVVAIGRRDPQLRNALELACLGGHSSIASSLIDLGIHTESFALHAACL